MMTNTIPQLDSDYTAYLRDYKALHPIRQNVLRAVAAQMLRQRADSFHSPELGTSDVSCQVFQIWKDVGGFNNDNFNDILCDLRDEWLSWASLPSER